MNEQDRIQYIKELSEQDLMNDITNDDVKFLIDIASRLSSFASEFDPMYSDSQMEDYSLAYQDAIKDIIF